MSLVTAGDNCIDYYINTGKGFPGGNPVNVAVYAKRYISDVSYIGVVGDDENGRMMLSSLKRKDVDVSSASVFKGGKTAVTTVELVGSERVFRAYDMGVHSAFTLSPEQLDKCCSSDCFVTGIWGKCERYVRKIHESGALVVFDFATKLNTSVFPMIAESVDYSFFSWEGEKNYDDIKKFMTQAVDVGTKCVVVTLGSDGSIAYDGKTFYREGIIHCPVVDTMGAGDSFIAGFVCSIMNGGSIQEAMRKGSESSAITIQYNGAW